MPIMTDNLSGISPTVTLAELYESQRHYVAAYTILRYLALKQLHKEDTPGKKTVEDKKTAETHLERLKDRVFGSGYRLQTIDSIFSAEEATSLGILSAKSYEAFLTVIDELLDKEINEFEAIEAEDEHLFARLEKQISNEWEQIIASERLRKEQQDKASFEVARINWSEIRLIDFIEFLFVLKEDVKSLSDIKMSEIMEIFLSRYRIHDEKKR